MDSCSGRYDDDFQELNYSYVSGGSISCSKCGTRLSMTEGDSYSQFIEHCHRHDIAPVAERFSPEAINHNFSGKALFREILDNYDNNVSKKKTTVIVLPHKDKEETLEKFLTFMRSEHYDYEVELDFQNVPNLLRLGYNGDSWILSSDMGARKLWERRYIYLKDYDLNMEHYCMRLGVNYENLKKGDACPNCEYYIDENSTEEEKQFFGRQHFSNAPTNDFVRNKMVIRWLLRILAAVLLYRFLRFEGSLIIDTLAYNSFDFSFLLNPYTIGKLVIAGILLFKSDIPLKTIIKYGALFLVACVVIYIVFILVALYFIFAGFLGSGGSSSEDTDDGGRYNQGNAYYGPTPQQQAEIAHLERQINYMRRTGRRL